MERYAPDYREPLPLRDGRTVEVRRIRPDDGPLLLAGFRTLSDESRYYRFFAHKTSLSAQDLDYLTRVDGRRHLALVAEGRRADGSPEGLGVARFVRDDAGGEAEAAIVVADACQRQGLGRALLVRLAEAAAERGLRALRFVALVENRALEALVRHTFARVEVSPIEDGTRTFRVPLGPAGAEVQPGAAVRPAEVARADRRRIGTPRPLRDGRRAAAWRFVDLIGTSPTDR